MRFLVSKIIAVAMIRVAAVMAVAYGQKVMPFGIESGIALQTVWAYTGWFWIILLFGGGLYLLFKEGLDLLERKFRGSGKK